MDINIYLNGMKVGYYLLDHSGSGQILESASYYCLYDGQGNIVQISNKVGNKPYYLFKYDSYGNTLNCDTNNGDGELEPSGYKGYSESAIYFKTGARHYDPNTGTFMTPDPFKGYMGDPASQHPYMYCAGNPVRYADPSGYDYLTFNGKRLAWHNDNGKIVNSWEAHSGTAFPFNSADENIPDFGPIVQGTYIVDPRNIDTRSLHKNPDKTYGSESAWGKERVLLIPDEATKKRIEELNRKGEFFIHGGRRIGTIGCVEICDYSKEQKEQKRFFDSLYDYGKPIKLFVKYK